MDNITKQITNLKKQNDGMETSFKNKGIEFNKLSIDTVEPEMELTLLKEYNEYLKNISKSNRPPPQEKPAPTPKPVVETAKKEKSGGEEGEDDDIDVKEVKPTFSTITNMEDIKRAFFNKDYETFQKLVREHPFKFYKSCYKYTDDYDGRPNFVAKNLLRGFVQNLDDYRKYLMVGFRCILFSENTLIYRYPGYWIVNSNDDLKSIIGSLYDDFEFNEVTNDAERVLRMLRGMQKNEDENDNLLIGEVYVH